MAIPPRTCRKALSKESLYCVACGWAWNARRIWGVEGRYPIALLCHVPSKQYGYQYMISVFAMPNLTHTPCPWLEDNPSTLYECLVICLGW